MWFVIVVLLVLAVFGGLVLTPFAWFLVLIAALIYFGSRNRRL